VHVTLLSTLQTPLACCRMEPQISAADYDRMIEYASHPPETDEAVAGLVGLVEPGSRVLELGPGTGRLAIPLATEGLEVHGVELDPEMVEQLRKKPGGDRVQVHIGDMSQPIGAGRFDLIFVAFGTLFALPSQEAQVRCFKSAASQLMDGGHFVVEALVLQPSTYKDGRKVTVAAVDEAKVILSVGLLDPVQQTLTSQQVVLSGGDVRLFPNRIRYAWPAELDLMAQLAGMRLSARWSDWHRSPFGERDPRHISVYER
jgi:SAM-dependent methyltransferase